MRRTSPDPCDVRLRCGNTREVSVCYLSGAGFAQAAQVNGLEAEREVTSHAGENIVHLRLLAQAVARLDGVLEASP